MAIISDFRLATDMTRAMGKSLVRAGVDMLLSSNTTAENDQAPLSRCRSCDGNAVIEIGHGDQPYPTEPVQEQSSNGKEAGPAPSSTGRGRPAASIGEQLYSMVREYALGPDTAWRILTPDNKVRWEKAANTFLDFVNYTGKGDLETQNNLLSDEVDGLSLSLTRVREALKTVGARQNCDEASAIISLAEKYEHEIQNNNRGFSNILGALKDSGAVVDYSNPLQAAKDIAIEYRALADAQLHLDEALRNIRDEIREVVDVNDMETLSGVKRLVALTQQWDRRVVNERTDAVVRTLGQMKSYIEATMSNVEKQRAATP